MSQHTKETPGVKRPTIFGRMGVFALALAVLPLAACDTIDDLIRADNPAELLEDELNDATLAQVLTNSIQGRLAIMYDDYIIWRASMITDEQVTGINWEQTARLNERFVRYDQETAMFGHLSAYRFQGDSVSGRLRNLLANPNSDRRLALALAHSGYGYNFIGEIMCEATLNVGATVYTPMQMFEMAIPRFEEAIQIATAAGSAADRIRNLARVGLARAALNANQMEKAMAAVSGGNQYGANPVPADFVWWIEYQDGVVTNAMESRVVGANHSLGVHPRFLSGNWLQNGLIATQTDPRVQHWPNHRAGHNANSPLYTPFAGIRYSVYNGRTIAAAGTHTGANAPALYTRSMSIALASGVEARHHYYEAAGATGTGPWGTTLEFVNARRAYGNQPAVAYAGAELMSELRDQRARDTYMGGFRLGDLRRWERQGVNDPRHVFPSGDHPVAGWAYHDATCFPLPLQEYVGNPNIRR
jgi:hypothetical protein